MILAKRAKVGGFQPSFSITPKMAAALSAIERARGFLEGSDLSGPWLQAMANKALVLEAHHTTHIEGTQLTLDDSRRAWAGKAPSGARKDDVRELLNYRAASGFVERAALAPVTEKTIQEIHRRLVVGVRGGEASPGRYRTMQNYVADARTGRIIYTPPTPADVGPMMDDLVTWLAAPRPQDVHPVLVAGIAQFQLVHIHPFVDGNGRTSRLLSTLCLYRSGYDFKRLFTLSEFYDRDRARFYAALQSVREEGMDLTPWLEYFLEGLAEQVNEVQAQAKTALKTKTPGLTERQTAIVQLTKATGRLTLAELEGMLPQTSRRTLQRDLKALVEKGLLTEVGATTDPNRAYAIARKSKAGQV